MWRRSQGNDVRYWHKADGWEAPINVFREKDQRCLIVRPGVAGAVACLDTLPARLATLIGVRGRRAAQNAATASVTAALISV